MASLKSNSPLDPIPLTLLRTLLPLLIEPITMIIHASLITSIVPKSMKHSYITPIIKQTTLSHSNLSSYRPISQLSSIFKTLERFVSAQLIHYITTNSIIDKFQSAYLPHRSTESALNLIINDLLISLDNKAPCYLVLLNLSSAFDTLNHDILSLRLNEIGIHGQVHSWFMSFLSLRSSSVKINSSFSTPFISTHGVPQGSVLGPLLFIIYILPIQSIFRKYPYIHYHLFADDLQIYTSFPISCDSNSIQLSIFNRLTELTDWFSHNSLSLNMTKTDTIIISRPTYPLIITHPFLLALLTSQSITTLGFTINSHLDYSDHISIMIRNANYFLYNIRKSRNKLTFSMTKSLIHSLVFSRLIYCCSLLCNLPLKLMLKLEKIQRRAIRTLYKLKFSSIVSISTLMRSLGWLKFRYLCRYRLLCITHKVIHLRSPEYLADLISIHTLSRASRKCHTMKIVQRSTISAHSDSAFSVVAPKYWNSLPYDIRCLKSLSLFKCKLSTHLLTL